MYIPARGDIVSISFDPQMGREIQKTRPALVISTNEYNLENNLALFLPITCQIKGHRYERRINSERVKGVVLLNQARSMDWRARKTKKIISLDEEQVAEILSSLQQLLLE